MESSVSTRTIDYAAALEFYTANKLTILEEEDQKEAAGKNDRKQQNDDSTAVEASYGSGTLVSDMSTLPFLPPHPSILTLVSAFLDAVQAQGSGFDFGIVHRLA